MTIFEPTLEAWLEPLTKPPLWNSLPGCQAVLLAVLRQNCLFGFRASTFLRHWVIRLSSFIVLLTLPLYSLSANGSPIDGLLVDEGRFSGALVSVDQQWRLTFHGGNKRLVAAADLIYWGERRARNKTAFIHMSDGSLFVLQQPSDIVSLRGDALTVETELWGRVTIPLIFVKRIVIAETNSSAQWESPIAQSSVRQAGLDRLLLTNGDILSGQLTTWADGRLTVRGLRNNQLQVSVNQVVAIELNSSRVPVPFKPGFHALVGLRDESLLSVRQMSLDERQVELTLLSGIKLTSATFVRPVEEQIITSVQPLSSCVTYLSDLEPISFKHIPYLDLTWPYKNEQNVLGGRLKVRDVVYSKGIGMHSTSRLAYQLNKNYRRFDAELAIDDRAGQGGSVVFRVFVDHSGQWTSKYQSPTVRGSQPPLTCSVDVRQADRLAIVVDFADRADQLDYANWLNARLISVAKESDK